MNGRAGADVTLIFIVAGEPSGDALGARLMTALSARMRGAVRFAGVGGDRMKAAGLDSLFPLGDLAVMGLVEVVPHLPRLLRRLGETVAAAERLRPDVIVTIDAPSFSFRVGRRLRGSGIPHVHYVAPQVWAWRSGRARKVAKFLDHLIALLPFEPPLFEAHGLDCTFAGHPGVEDPASPAEGAAFRAAHGIAAETPVLCLLPGSRQGEVTRLLPIFAATVERVRHRVPGLHVVLPTVETVADRVISATVGWALNVTILRDSELKPAAYAASDVALAASGSVAIELAAARLPMVIGYRANPVSVAVFRLMTDIRYVNLINLILDRPVVPELLMGDCTPARLAGELVRLFDDAPARLAQIDGEIEATRLLGQDSWRPSERAAEAVLSLTKFSNNGARP